MGSGAAPRSRARAAQKVLGAGRQAPNRKGYPQTNRGPQASFPNSANPGTDPLQQRACPSSLKLVSRSWRPHLSSDRLPEVDVPPNQVPSQDHPSPARSSTVWASNTWLCADRGCGLDSPSRTGSTCPAQVRSAHVSASPQDAVTPTAVGPASKAWPRPSTFRIGWLGET